VTISAGSEWHEIALGNVLTLQRGFDLPSRERVDGPFPIVSSSGITGRHAVAKVDPPGVVIGRYGSLGLVHWVTKSYWPLNTSLWVKDFKGNDPRYVSYLLRTVNVDSSTASAVPGVNRNHLHQLFVCVPSVGTQKRIAALLTAFDDLIEINERRIELLEDLARSLYREWFVRFRFPGSPRTLRSGDAPNGWRGGTIGDVCDAVRGRSYRKSELSGTEGVLFLNLKCVGRAGGFRPDGLKRYTGRFKDTQRVEVGDVLVAVTDMTQERRIVAQAFRMPDLGVQFAIPSLDLVMIKPNVSGLRTYLYAFLRYSGFSNRVRQFANGANVLHLAIERILEAPFLLPDEAVLSEFTRHTDALLSESEFLQKVNRSLAATRDLLLPRLVTGKLDISDVDMDDLLATEVS
jgi:type I restriction enzyme S subunit